MMPPARENRPPEMMTGPGAAPAAPEQDPAAIATQLLTLPPDVLKAVLQIVVQAAAGAAGGAAQAGPPGAPPAAGPPPAGPPMMQ